MSLRDQILSSADTRLEPVPVPEWGCTVFVPVVTVEDMEHHQKGSGPNTLARMACFVIRDEQGQRIFTDADAPAMAKRSVTAVNRIITKFNEINGFTEDPAKNSLTPQGSASN